MGDISVGRFENGSLTKIGLHAIMGGLAAEAAGGDFKIGALAAGANEALIDTLAHQYDNMSQDQRSGLLTMNSQVLGVLVASMAGGDEKDMQTGAWVAGNATQYNYLTHNKLKEIQECLGGTSCNSSEQKEAMIRDAEDLSKMLDQEMTSICSASPSSDACRTAVHSAIQYVAMTEAWELMNGDVSRSSRGVFDQLYNSQDAEKWFGLHLNSIDKRADFFGASDRYEQSIGSGARWFGGAEFVSRARLTGLGADGNASSYTFALGSLLAGWNAMDIYEWRSEAGSTLINSGFENFKALYNNGADPVRWDIKQLKDEQTSLQNVHNKYLIDKEVFTSLSGFATDSEKVSSKFLDNRSTISGGVDILDYKSRINYGCKLLGYGLAQGCTP